MNRILLLDDLTQTEKANFQKVCRKLLKMTFIVKEKNEEHRKDFAFIKEHISELSEYFQVIGYDVIYDKEAGVARLVNMSSGDESSLQSNRKRFRLAESIVLSSLWLIYEEMLVNGSLTRAVVISKSELDFQLEKFGAKNKFDKTSMSNILKLLESYNLIEVIGQVGEPDCRIRLFTSMQFCLSDEEFKNVAENTAAKINFVKNASDTEMGESEDNEQD